MKQSEVISEVECSNTSLNFTDNYFITLYTVKGFFVFFVIKFLIEKAPISEDLGLEGCWSFKVGIPLFFFIEKIILHSFDFSF